MTRRPPGSTLTYPPFPYTTLFRSAVADASKVQRLGQHRATLVADVLQPEAAPFQSAGQVVRRAVECQLAFVEQQHRVAALGLVQIGGRPHHRQDRKSTRLNSSH